MHEARSASAREQALLQAVLLQDQDDRVRRRGRETPQRRRERRDQTTLIQDVARQHLQAIRIKRAFVSRPPNPLVAIFWGTGKWMLDGPEYCNSTKNR